MRLSVAFSAHFMPVSSSFSYNNHLSLSSSSDDVLCLCVFRLPSHTQTNDCRVAKSEVNRMDTHILRQESLYLL